MINKIKKYTESNDWDSILELFDPLEELEKTDYWNDKDILMRIAYASGKICEIGRDYKKTFKSDYNKQKRALEYSYKYFKLSEKINLRVLEISKNNSFMTFAGIGYLYYHKFRFAHNDFFKILKLTKEDFFSKAIQYHKSAINIMPNHITTLYRLGVLYYDQIALNFKSDNFAERTKLRSESIETGLNCLKKAIKEWENHDEKTKKYFEKNFTKVLYNYVKINITDRYWTEFDFINHVFSLTKKSNDVELPFCPFNWDEMEEYISSCLQYNSQSGAMEKKDILHLHGLFFFKKYLYLSNGEQTISDEANEFLKKSLTFFQEADITKWSENTRNDDYIKYNIAQCLICSKNHDNAIELLKPLLSNRNLSSYILATLCCAVLSKQNPNLSFAEELMRHPLWRDHYNYEKDKKHIFQSVIFIRKKEYNKAIELMENYKYTKKWQDEAKNLILGWCYYQKGDSESGKRYFTLANERKERLFYKGFISSSHVSN